MLWIQLLISNWFLCQVELVDVDTDEYHRIHVNRWFSTGDDDRQTSREFSVSRPGEMPLPGNLSVSTTSNLSFLFLKKSI